MKKNASFLFLLIIVGFNLNGQRKIVNLPNLPGYVTLKCDFHMHSVFSDGNVWPTIRVDEALRDGLDAISITDHLEYSPKKNFIPVDHNAAWKISEAYAKERNFILVHGTEITRSMPPGHVNALFITDGSLIAKDSVWDSFEAAIKQGAFLQWNHPGWKSQQSDGIPRMYDMHRRLIKNGWLHGIEFSNGTEYYPLVFSFSKQYNIAITGNSDVHGMVGDNYSQTGGPNRSMTLVFAKEKSHDALKEAMFAGRTMAYFNNTIAGKEEFSSPFFYECISVGKPFLENDKNIYFEVTNNSDITFYLINGVANAPASVTLNANAVTRVIVSKKLTSPLTYDVSNVLTGEKDLLKVELKY